MSQTVVLLDKYIPTEDCKLWDVRLWCKAAVNLFLFGFMGNNAQVFGRRLGLRGETVASSLAHMKKTIWRLVDLDLVVAISH